MRTKAPWGIAALLGATCLGEAGYIVAHRAAASASTRHAAGPRGEEDLGRVEERMHEAIARAGKLADQDFDQLFGDEFFRRRFDPFAEVGRMSRRIEQGLDASERALFASSFHDWFSKRLDLTGITTNTADEGKDVALTFGIPGLDADSVNLDVNANRIRLRYGARKDVKKGGSEVETTESVEKVLPLPAGADPNGFEVRKGKDEITLVFHKIEHGKEDPT
jgi:HSP20 family molecular chaperone IbpA